MRLGDLPLFVDQVGDALRVFILRSLGGAVRETDLAFRVAEEGEGEVELAREGVVVFGSVEADAEDLGVLREVLLVEVPEPGTLPRSARSVGLRIKPEHDLAPAQIMQRNLAALMIGDLKVRSLVAHVQHASSSERIQYEPQLACQRHAAIVVEVGKAARSTLPY